EAPKSVRAGVQARMPSAAHAPRTLLSAVVVVHHVAGVGLAVVFQVGADGVGQRDALFVELGGQSAQVLRAESRGGWGALHAPASRPMRISSCTSSPTTAISEGDTPSTEPMTSSTTGEGLPTTIGVAPVACTMPAAIGPDVLGMRPPREANHGAIDVTSKL